MITSTQNAKVKWVRSLVNNRQARQKSQAFVAEGVRLVEEGLYTNVQALLAFYTDEIGERGQEIIEVFSSSGVPVEEISSQVMKSTSDTQTPQGILVVFQTPTLPLPQPLDFVFIADRVRDPGNLGTVLRTAAAVGVDSVILSPKSVDPYAPKVVRAAMGAHFRLPIIEISWDEISEHIRDNDLRVFLAAADKGTIYNQADYKKPLAIVVGGEVAGVSEAARNLADEWVRIPMPGGGESLNASVAAAILMYEVIRQRKLTYTLP